MILFTIFVIALIIAAVIGAVALITGGAAFIAVFGDVIIFGLIIGLLVRLLFKRRKK